MIEPQHRSSPMPRLCTMYAISLHDRRACVPWQGVCAGAHGGACGRSAGHRAYRQPCCCPRISCPCGEASARPTRQGRASGIPHLFLAPCCRAVHPPPVPACRLLAFRYSLPHHLLHSPFAQVCGTPARHPLAAGQDLSVLGSPARAVLSLAYGTLDTRQRGDLLTCC